MIAEMLGVLPRLVRSLSDIVYAKTEGNPLFALEFMRSLVDRRLLKYSLRERQWIWEVDVIAQEDISDNVLFLLTTKMKMLSESVQSALKLLSCLGIRTNEVIVASLSSTPQHSDLQECLEECIRQGFLIKGSCSGDFKFVHDKGVSIQSKLRRQRQIDLCTHLLLASQFGKQHTGSFRRKAGSSFISRQGCCFSLQQRAKKWAAHYIPWSISSITETRCRYSLICKWS